ncbi:MAG TPA: hypothetical protein VKY92_02555 [Verrucomicrobiae bacterium]|nr:hypothetical protein [Verrucomicrobiae bacterium]
MAREESHECGLPSLEERRRILFEAGMILEEARDLVARLDRHESRSWGTNLAHRQYLERIGQQRHGLVPGPPLNAGTGPQPAGGGQALAA